MVWLMKVADTGTAPLTTTGIVSATTPARAAKARANDVMDRISTCSLPS
jgi:hypothetical protein